LPLLGLRGYAYSDMDLLFDEIDTNKSDFIEYAELWRLLRQGASIELEDERLKAGAVAFDVREKGASSACRSSMKDSRFESKALKPASLEEMRNALKRDRKRVIDAFRCLDKDGSGAVSKAEFRAALPILGFESDADTADAVFEELDEDESGKIEYEELNKKLRQGRSITLAAELQDGARGEINPRARNAMPVRASAHDGILTKPDGPPATVEDIRESLLREHKRVIDVFRACDVDQSGCVTKREFRAALPTLGFSAGGREAIDALFGTFDIDGNGEVEFKELNAMLRYEAKRSLATRGA
jgi:Ca2+-binding EF-hand superfamily protein